MKKKALNPKLTKAAKEERKGQEGQIEEEAH